ncbi:MAG: hypothetical protein N2314_09075 [Brevinematales bacterium]|nr:hypothetical protein [Brevinematales bacterium]
MGGEKGMVYGKRYFFVLDTPEKWILDTTYTSEGLSHLIYPEKYRETENLYIYARGADHPNGKTNNLQDFINGDTNDFLSVVGSFTFLGRAKPMILGK